MFVLAGLAAMLMSPAAHAGFCAAGSSCTFDLLNTNITGFNIDVLVTVNNTGPSTVLTVTFVSDNVTNTPLGIDSFAYNSNVFASSLPAGWSQAACSGPGNPPCQMDGFGAFDSEIDSPAGTDLSFSFTLASLVTTFVDNANGGEFAGHIRYSGGCSAFFSDGTAVQNPNTSCIPENPPPRLPEPGSLLLLGIALVGLTFARRRVR
jgi:hypothetical protein